MTHPDRLIVTWRTAIEAAARRADIAAAGPYSRDDTVHMRRVGTLKRLAQVSPELHRNFLVVLDLFDRATARGNAAVIQQAGERLVKAWELAAAKLALPGAS
jgi:hypothetical protein